MAAAVSKATARDTTAELAFLTRALKAPTLRESVPRLAERARAESWTHEEFLAACLQREVAARESHGGEGRIRAARFPARKSLEEFDPQRGTPVPQAAGQRHHLRPPPGRRPASHRAGQDRGPGRATGERLCRQRGRLTPRAPALRPSHSRTRIHTTTPARSPDREGPHARQKKVRQNPLTQRGFVMHVERSVPARPVHSADLGDRRGADFGSCR